MGKGVYYVKSLEEDFATKSLKGKRKITCQTVLEIVLKKCIRPNTQSFGRKKRLSCTILHKEYTKTYRPQGIIFLASEQPDYVLPCDMVLLSAAEKIVVHYYRIKNNLHVYYNHGLIPGFKKFIFRDFSSMAKKYPSPKKVWKEINKFREEKGFRKLPKQKFRLAEYNEAVFHRPVRIEPVAIFGYRKNARATAKKTGLPLFRSARNFWKKMENKKTCNQVTDR